MTVSVRTEIDGRVATIVIDRPERRNAVDGPTAAALADAFRAFDANPDLDVAVLWGAGDCFCAGADLKALAGETESRNRVAEDGDAPMGISRLPQLCLRQDRLSALEQQGLQLDAALRNEFRRGMLTINGSDIGAGAGRFTAGGGRHGEAFPESD